MKLSDTMVFSVAPHDQQSISHGLEVDGVAVLPNDIAVGGDGLQDVSVSYDNTNVTVINSSDYEVSLSVFVQHWFSAAEDGLLSSHCVGYCVSQGMSDSAAQTFASDNLTTLRAEAIEKWGQLIADKSFPNYDQSAWGDVKAYLESWILANIP